MKIMIAIPNMLNVNQYIFSKLAYWSSTSGHEIRVSMLPEARHHDYARNVSVREFLSTDCEFLLFLDSDIDPHSNVIKLVDYDKDIIAANVFAWQKGELMSSIWRSAKCEECAAVKVWQLTGTLKDPREYAVDDATPNVMYRWNPYFQRWEPFYDRDKREFAPGCKCRCLGTGKDVFVYTVHPDIARESAPIKVDAVGAASICIKRRVLEAMELPWFQFLYRPDRELMLTEDLHFCVKAKKMGFEIFADQHSVCGHYKTINLLAMNQFAGKVFEMGKKEGSNGRIIRPPDFS